MHNYIVSIRIRPIFHLSNHLVSFKVYVLSFSLMSLEMCALPFSLILSALLAC